MSILFMFCQKTFAAIQVTARIPLIQIYFEPAFLIYVEA